MFEGDQLAWLYRAVNYLKISTREEVVRQELLVSEGEPFDEFLVAESVRNLRSLPFLRQVSITSLKDGDFVDLVVSVQDTWTLFPQIGFSSGGGSSKKSIV